jgi:myo-inositol-1(or 4)-monophosphatase
VSHYQHELDTAHAIALAAADVVRSYAGKKVRIDSKAGNEPVTEADHAANALIVERLRAAFPDDAILSEELPDDGSRQGGFGWSTPSTAPATSSWATSASPS